VGDVLHPVYLYIFLYEKFSISKSYGLINRERDIQRQWKKSRITKARYNKRYKEIRVKERKPRYLRKKRLEQVSKGEEIRVLDLKV